MVQRILLNHYLARTAGMLSGARRASLMLLVMLLTTSTAWAQNPASIGSISYNNSISAYEINSVNNLNDLAVYVNGTGTYSTGDSESTDHTCTGMTFKMTAPITYDGSVNNYTPIGNDSQSFYGTFDGQGKTISGININNTSATDQAIFGSVQGTVKNLVVSNCSIVACQQVGAIAGTMRAQGTIENCSVGNDVTLSGNSGIGGISGGNDGGTIKGCTCAATINGTEASGLNAYYLGGIAGSASDASGPTPYLTDNRFTGAIDGDLDEYIGAIIGWSDHASLTNNIYTSTGFGGIGAASSPTGADGVGASQPYSVTFDENGGTAVPDLEVALGTVISAPATTREGYTLTGWKNGSTDFDFSTPVTSNLELTAQWVEKIPYIDADGNTAYCTNYTVLNNTMTTISEGWYVVKSDVTFSGNLSTNASGEVHIILCDGATLTANYIVFGHSNRLYIYGQSQGTGTASISYIEASNSLQICGGIINVTDEITCPTGSVGIYGGNVTAAEISGKYNLTFTGGTITAGSLTADEGSIKLGGATVKANSYSANNGVTITNGITYYDGTGASYTEGNLTSDQISAIRGKTLRTYDYRSGTCGKDDPATDDVDESQNVTWLYNVSTKTLTISGTGAMKNCVSGKPWNDYRSFITSVVIENGVTSIGDFAFQNYSNLTSVTFDGVSTLASIDSYAFSYTGLTSISIPASVTSIGECAFIGCNNLASVSGCEGVTSIGQGAFHVTAWFTNQPDGVIYIGEVAYYGKNVSGVVSIDAGKVSISDGAFVDCTGLTSISIPASVTSIGMNAFWDCSDLTSVTISAGVTSIGSGAFMECTSLQSVTIPASVTSIGEMAFSGCTSLASVIIHATSLSTYGMSAFDYNKDERKIYVPSSAVDTYKTEWTDYVDYIEAMAAYGTCGATGNEDKVIWSVTGTPSNYTLTISGAGAMADYTDANYQPWAANRLVIKTIVINEGVTSIGKYAFSNCEEATSVSIPASVTSIGYYSFNFCPNLSSLNIAANSSLKTIDNNAFYLCSGLESVSIPASVTSIGSSAFDCCSNLATVTLNSNPSIGEHAFDDIKAGATVTMNLTANGPVDEKYWMTFYNENYSFEADANTQMFKAALGGTALTLTELATDQIVNKNNAVILKSTASPIVMTLTTDGSNDFTGNSLQGVDNPAGLTAADPSTTYVLNNGSNGVGFYKLQAGSKLGVGKAYLTYSGTTAPGFFGLDVDNENTTAINEHELNESHELSGAWYDLQGRKIANGQKPTAKGLYIVNGKKVMIK